MLSPQPWIPASGPWCRDDCPGLAPDMYTRSGNTYMHIHHTCWQCAAQMVTLSTSYHCDACGCSGAVNGTSSIACPEYDPDFAARSPCPLTHPRMYTAGMKRLLTFRVDDALARAVQAKASGRGDTMTDIVTGAFRAYLDDEEPAPPAEEDG